MGGSAVLDNCGVCDGDGSTCNFDCNDPVCLNITNVDIDAGTLDIYMTNQSGCSFCSDSSYNNQENCEL